MPWGALHLIIVQSSYEIIFKICPILVHIVGNRGFDGWKGVKSNNVCIIFQLGLKKHFNVAGNQNLGVFSNMHMTTKDIVCCAGEFDISLKKK